MAFVHYLTVLLSAVTVHGQSVPTITFISPPATRDIGGQIDVGCAVEHARGYPVEWVKYTENGEILPLSVDSSLSIKDARFSIRSDAKSSAYFLSIRDIQETDVGLYQCQVIVSEDKKITADVDLQVRRPPVIYDNSTRSLVTSEGESVQMACYAGGFPPPQISWHREYKAILPTGGSAYSGNILNIPSVQKEHRGTYYCAAKNGVGKGSLRTINLEITFSPVVTVPHPQREKDLQQDVYLSCHVDAYPPPGITWYKDEIPLSSNQTYTISNFATTDDSVDTSLRINAIQEQHYGNYTCKAQNRLGDDEGHVELIGSPILPKANLTEPVDIST